MATEGETMMADTRRPVGTVADYLAKGGYAPKAWDSYWIAGFMAHLNGKIVRQPNQIVYTGDQLFIDGTPVSVQAE